MCILICILSGLSTYIFCNFESWTNFQQSSICENLRRLFWRSISAECFCIYLSQLFQYVFVSDVPVFVCVHVSVNFFIYEFLEIADSTNLNRKFTWEQTNTSKFSWNYVIFYAELKGSQDVSRITVWVREQIFFFLCLLSHWCCRLYKSLFVWWSHFQLFANCWFKALRIIFPCKPPQGKLQYLLLLSKFFLFLRSVPLIFYLLSCRLTIHLKKLTIIKT